MKKNHEQSKEFTKLLLDLKEQGWSIYMRPILRIVDDTWILRRRSDPLEFLFVAEDFQVWERKRFTREPFGDYTVPYRDLGGGKDLKSLYQNLTRAA